MEVSRQQLQSTSEKAKKDFELLEKEKSSELNDLKIDLNRKIGELEQHLDLSKQSAESEALAHKNETTIQADASKSQMDILTQNMTEQIETLKRQNLTELSELHIHYDKQQETIYQEKVSLEQEKQAANAQLQRELSAKRLLESMNEFQLKALQDQLETVRRERQTAENEFRRMLEESIHEKDQLLANVTKESEESVKKMSEDLEENKRNFEKNQFESEQSIKQLRMQMETDKVQSDSYCEQRDRQIQKLQTDAKIQLEKMESDHKEKVEQIQVKLEEMNKKLAASHEVSQAEFSKLLSEYEAEKVNWVKVQEHVINSYAQQFDEMNQTHFDLVKDLQHKQEEQLNIERKELTERNLKINDLEETIRASDLKMAETERNFKSEIDVLESRKNRESDKLMEQIVGKNKHLDLIMSLHESEIKENKEKHRDEKSGLEQQLEAVDRENVLRLEQLKEIHIGQTNEKEEALAHLKVLLKQVNSEKEREVSGWRLKHMLQREEWCANVNELNHRHIIDLSVKNEEIEALTDEIKENILSHEEQKEQMTVTMQQYREHLDQEKQEMLHFREDLKNEKETEVSRLNEQIANLESQNTHLREEMLNQENQLQEQFFQQTTILKSNFTAIQAEIEQQLHQTELALQKMTAEKDLHVSEGIQKDERIRQLESDLARLKQDLDNKIDEMAKELAKMAEEKRLLAEKMQKALDDLLEEKRQMEIAKDKELQETKISMSEDFKKMRSELNLKIKETEDERNNLDMTIKQLHQKYTGMLQDKDNELAQFTKSIKDKHQNELNKINKEHAEIVDKKETAIAKLQEDLAAQKSEFEKQLTLQKEQFNKSIAEKETLVKNMQQKHAEVCKNNKQHIENLRTNLSDKESEMVSKVSELELQLKNSLEQINQLESSLNETKEQLTSSEAKANLADSKETELKTAEANLQSKHSELGKLTTAFKTLQNTEKG